MNYRERIVHGTIASEHILQLFDGPDSLGEGVAGFFHDGIVAGDHCLMVARPLHAMSVAEGLDRRNCPAAPMIESGHFTVLDAGTTLRQFMWNGSPDAQRFEQSVGDLVRSLSAAAGGRLSIYGEMVDVLAEEGNFHGAGELEALWNRLAQQVSFRLLCGYASAHFAAPNGRASLIEVCGHHQRVRQNDTDMLANWLIGSHGTAAPLSA